MRPTTGYTVTRQVPPWIAYLGPWGTERFKTLKGPRVVVALASGHHFPVINDHGPVAPYLMSK